MNMYLVNTLRRIKTEWENKFLLIFIIYGFLFIYSRFKHEIKLFIFKKYKWCIINL